MSRTYGYASGLLKQSMEIVNTDRKVDYGDAYDSFGVIAEFWTAYLRARGLLAPGVEVLRSDVSMLMDLLKTSRHATGGYKEDTFVDKGGYSCLAGALARIEKELATPKDDERPGQPPNPPKAVAEAIEYREPQDVFTSPGFSKPLMLDPKGFIGG